MLVTDAMAVVQGYYNSNNNNNSNIYNNNNNNIIIIFIFCKISYLLFKCRSEKKRYPEDI